MELANGSRIVSLPGEASTIRGYSGANTPIRSQHNVSSH
jgi:hypothetical protein